MRLFILATVTFVSLTVSDAYAGRWFSRGGCSSCAGGSCQMPVEAKADLLKPSVSAVIAQPSVPAPKPPVFLSEIPVITASAPVGQLTAPEVPGGEYLDGYIQAQSGKWYPVRFLLKK